MEDDKLRDSCGVGNDSAARRRHQVSAALRSIFLTVYELDYTDMTATEVFRDLGTSNQFGEKLPLMAGYEIAVSQLVHPDDVLLYDSVYRPENVETLFDDDDRDSYWAELRMKCAGDEYAWVRTGLVRIENDEGHLLFIACTKDIQQERDARETAEQLQYKEIQNAVMERILKNIPAGIFIFSLDGGFAIRYANDASYAMMGLPLGEVEGLQKHAAPLIGANAMAAISAESATGRQIALPTTRIIREDGEERWISASIVPAIDEETGERLYYCATLDDTEQVMIEQAFNRQTDLYRMALDSTDDVVFEYDIAQDTMQAIGTRSLSSGVLDVTDGFCAHLMDSGFASKEDVPRIIEALTKPDCSGAVSRGDIMIDLAGDQMQWWRVQYKTIVAEDGEPERVIGIVREIGEEHRLASELAAQIESKQGLEREASTDSLTGLLNRSAFKKQVDLALDHPNPEATFFILDIDDFKAVNDTLGHQKGDELLARTGSTLRKLFRAGDLVGRLGGDEFVVFVGSTNERDRAAKRAAAILKGISQAGSKGFGGIAISVSIGIAAVPADGTDFKSVYAAADAALYTAKKLGKGRFEFA